MRQGVLFEIEGDCGRSLFTQWGEFKLYPREFYVHLDAAERKVLITQLFQRLEMTFHHIKIQRGITYYCKPLHKWLASGYTFQPKYIIHNPTEELFAQYQGKPVVIYKNSITTGYEPIFSINSLDGEKLALPVYKPTRQEYRAPELCMLLWSTLRVMLKEEQQAAVAKLSAEIEDEAFNSGAA